MYLLFYWRCFVIAKNDDLLINDKITAKEVMVIGPGGEQLGVKSLQDALTLANAAGFDLVQMNGNSDKPVCKLMDYNKFKYERNKKQKEALKKQKSTAAELKEIRLSVKIDIHDFNTRVNQTNKFLEKGHKIKAVVRFKGREMAHPELGKDVLDRFVEAVKDYGTKTSEPTMEFRSMYVNISPNKKEGN